MNEYKKAFNNDGYNKFDKEYACWANNHNGWRKAKKVWRRQAKAIIKRNLRKEIEETINEDNYKENNNE